MTLFASIRARPWPSRCMKREAPRALDWRSVAFAAPRRSHQLHSSKILTTDKALLESCGWYMSLVVPSVDLGIANLTNPEGTFLGWLIVIVTRSIAASGCCLICRCCSGRSLKTKEFILPSGVVVSHGSKARRI